MMENKLPNKTITRPANCIVVIEFCGFVKRFLGYQVHWFQTGLVIATLCKI